MPNSNCLEGLQCPKCGSYEPFNIAIKTVIKIWDDGTFTDDDWHMWDADSYCRCPKCRHSGTVKNFRTGYNTEETGDE
jgi:predicted nucleic-acid-binding Zn-ribbon protein